ncbi:MAG: hypothetical protein DMG65_23615 [Candidatus Angelobacter sp. Gp1-AA117]|nr:MAG: hypothetical protein DMG65_23615 [Candidatus Angelobacter sp. Gp1-AA117]
MGMADRKIKIWVFTLHKFGSNYIPIDFSRGCLAKISYLQGGRSGYNPFEREIRWQSESNPSPLIQSKLMLHDVELECINYKYSNSSDHSNRFKNALEISKDELRQKYKRFQESHRVPLVIAFFGLALLCAGRFLVCTGRYGGRVRCWQSLLSLLLTFVFTAHVIYLATML